jgi:hypothetical protein
MKFERNAPAEEVSNDVCVVSVVGVIKSPDVWMSHMYWLLHRTIGKIRTVVRELYKDPEVTYVLATPSYYR